MVHQALYRRYRPRRFSEVKGQDHVVMGLRNAVRDGRVGHAYLFSGPRGTGKTSTARILAKALNCENLTDGEPDGTCASCLAIEAGTSYDLQELDAASNNKVEDIRDLVSRVSLGSPGRAKVYILDEVHMLTAAASNALLKTLEEPPGHVTFVLATTEPHKVLDTIRSRTQHYEFHLLPATELADHVRSIISDAQLDVGDDAVDYVLRAGGGSARDTLSALDQVAAAGGVTQRAESVDRLVDAVADGDTGLALQAVADGMATGRDPRVLGEELLARLRDVFLTRMGGHVDHVSDTEREKVEAWAARLTDRGTTHALEQVGEALLEMRQAPDPRVPLEVALVRLTKADADASLDALIARVELLERAVATGGATAVDTPAPATPKPTPSAAALDPEHPAETARAVLAAHAPPPDEAPPKPTASAAAAPPPPLPAPPPPPTSTPTPSPAPATSPGATGTVDRDALTLAWGDEVLPKLGGLTKALYAGGRFLAMDGRRATFALPNAAHRDRCEPKRAEVEQALTAHFGQPITLDLVLDDAPGSPPEPGPGTASGSASRAANGTKPDPDPDPEEAIDPAELADAPKETGDGLSRLTDAFPGAQLVEDE